MRMTCSSTCVILNSSSRRISVPHTLPLLCDTPIQVVFPDAQELLSALASIKADSNKGLADFTFSEGGFTILSVNTACSFQTSVFLSRKLFEQYRMAEDVCQMSLELGTLLFTLRLFISADADVGIVMQYPGPNQELIVKSNNHSSPSRPSDPSNPSIEQSMSTQYQNEKFLPTLFARIETASTFGGSANLIEHMGDTMTSTIFSDNGQMFREAVEDLSVGSKVARVELRDRPAQLTLSSASPDIEVFVDVPVHELTGFTCALPSIEHRYNLKHLVVALSASPNKHGEPSTADQEHHTGIYIDAQGMMKVTHMWSTRERRYAVEDEHAGSVDETGVQAKQEKMVATIFFLVPLAEDGDGDDGGAAIRNMNMEASIQSSRM